MSGPDYVTTSRGQIRLLIRGSGPTVVAIAGPTRAASCLADDLGNLFPERRIVVVEPPGIGGSARASVSTLVDEVETVADALAFLDHEPIDMVAFDLSAALVPGLAAKLTPERMVLVEADAASGWVDHSTVPPCPRPRADGSHLIAFWSFLRDRRLLRADHPTLPKVQGAALPDVSDLAASFVAAIARPEAFVSQWKILAAALPDALAALSNVPRVDAIADLPALLTISSLGVVVQRELPVTAPAAGTELWHQYLDTAAGRVHLRRAGSAGRPVLVLPTGGGSSAQFEPVIRGLAANRTVVAIDYFGNGLSEPLERIPDIAILAREAFAVADALGWSNFDVWGSHTGACVALEMTIQAPERIGRGVYEGPVMVTPEFRDDLLAHYFPDFAPDAFGTHLSRIWNWRRDVFLYWPWYRVEHSAARAIGLPSAEDLQLYAVGILESGSTYGGAYRAAFDYDSKARLPHLTRPAIITAGPHDMLSNALEDAEDLAPDGLLRIVATPETVWWPDPDPDAAKETMRIYQEFLG